MLTLLQQDRERSAADYVLPVLWQDVIQAVSSKAIRPLIADLKIKLKLDPLVLQPL